MHAPRLELPVTWHAEGGDRPGVIIRVAATGTVFWFRTKDGRALRATSAIDGTWREDHGCQAVTLGIAREGPRATPTFARLLDERMHHAARLVPWLLKTRWYPMTYMMIPGVKSSAQRLAEELEHWQGPEDERREAREKGAYLRRLLRGFHRASDRSAT